MSILGGLISAGGELQAGEAAQRAYNTNADIADANAGQALLLSAQEERQQRIIGRKAIGDIRVAYGASGVTMEGSAMDVLAESTAAAELDALNIKYKGETQAMNLRNQGRVLRTEGEQARRSSQTRAAATVLSSFAQTGMQLSGMGG